MNEYKRSILKKAGNICRLKRKLVKLSQRDISIIYGCSQQYISLFEKGMANDLLLYLVYESLDSPRTIFHIMENKEKKIKERIYGKKKQ